MKYIHVLCVINNLRRSVDYLDYLELFGGETGFIKEFKLTPYSDLPEYCYPDDDIPVGGNIEWNGGDLGFFYGENINYQKNSQISERLEKYKNRIPDNFLPILSNEFGVQMPEEVKFQNIYLIGKNLYDCFSRMIPV